MQKHLLALAAACCAIAAPVAQAAPADDLDRLMDDIYAARLKADPVAASAAGVEDYDRLLGDYSPAAMDARAAQAAAFLARLNTIDVAGLSPEDQADHAIVRRLLEETMAMNGFGQRLLAFSSYYSPWQGWAEISNSMQFVKGLDYEEYLARLEAIPAASSQVVANTGAALAAGHALPCVAVGGVEGSIRGAVAAAPEETRFYRPFARTRPADLTQEQWAALQERARATISRTVAPAYGKAADYIRDEYLPRCAKAAGALAQPDGAAFYAFRVGASTTTDLTPQQVHDIGLAEVARIAAEMETVAATAGYRDRAAFVDKLRTDPAYYATTPEELLAAASAQAKALDGLMPAYFNLLPRLPYGIRAVPAETAEGTTTAYYSSGSPVNGVAGHYYVNTSKLDQRPLWELPALTAHEAVPGHHHQIALQQELALHPLRREFAYFTAFTEGWGLYAERLGLDMGIYDTPEKDYGRLSYEMWRATRLVVDTGIHALGWTKEQAVAFMTENTALSAANIDAEVNRYISWPGQALGYKLGELKIRQLRERAEQELGPKFSLAAFNDAVLAQGPVPLDVLDTQIERWITAQKNA
ncbi:DUF885 domain-containing protein [Croceicoccus sp. F390]|uniref:DUF885 domain-containing protein n=1 Tax=Croceicoccus esteveae TaxID=3075597 RepID=A0ABU2ZE38_9SPHN|nr:DUF885 domain-containing protein [Croceicoccus sp. F390]MDT0574865.1 DUF885 domain-containing protein [Croceicoccus sp. F390]